VRLVRIPDSSRASREVGKVPISGPVRGAFGSRAVQPKSYFWVGIAEIIPQL